MKKVVPFFLSAIILLALNACAQKTNTRAVATSENLSGYSQATFAAGCFWHEEALFECMKGVHEVVSGYAGGTTKNPTYEDLETGNTGHAETVNIYYDPKVISYETLLKIYFAGQDPTQVNGQGNDLGTQYRSIAFYRTDAEQHMINDYIKALTASGKYHAPIATQVVPFTKFWEAEAYHQNYVVNNPDQGYVAHVSIPEIIKVQKEYPQLVKPGKFF